MNESFKDLFKQKNLSEFLDAIAMPIALLNESGVIIYHNRAWRDTGRHFLCGELCVGDNYLETLGKKNEKGFTQAMDIFDCMIKLMISKEREICYDYDYLKKHYRLKISSYQLGGNKLILMNEDITAQKENEIVLFDIEKRFKIMNAVYEMADKPIEEIINFALENTLNLMQAEFGFAGFLNESESAMAIYHSWSKKTMAGCEVKDKRPIYQINDAGCWADAIRQRRTIIVNQYSKNFKSKKGIPAGHIPIDNFISVPIFDGNKIKMLIALANKKNGFDENGTKTISMIFNSAWNVARRKQEGELLNEAYEKLKNIDDMKTNFISMVSHELRTPLTSIIGFNKLVRKKFEKVFAPLVDKSDSKLVKARNEVFENFNIIISESERLISLINNVLDIQKLEAGQATFDMQPADVLKLINKSHDAVLPLLKSKNIDFIVEADEKLPAVVCDHEKITQVLINLFSNAIKFTTHGYIKCRAAKYNDDEIIISVIDTGAGIDNNDFEFIFDKFKQSGDTLKKGDHEKGTGLGLAICREIIERHDGKIWVDSVLGHGSEFYFTLTINYKDNQTLIDNLNLITDSLKENVFDMLGRNCDKFIIIDSNEKVLNLLEIAVNKEGHKSRVYKNPVEALLSLKSGFKKPDAIIVTEEISENSLDIVKIIKNDPVIYDIPIFIVKLKPVVIDSKSFITIEKISVW